MLNEIEIKVLKLSIEYWNTFFCGVSAQSIANELSYTNEEIMKVVEALTSKGFGTINRNVELGLSIMELLEPIPKVTRDKVTTHIFFPSPQVLEEAFFSDELNRNGVPEYKKRLKCGAHQLSMLYFREEVLSKYFSHPEYYEVDDSLSGGHISTKDAAPLSTYVGIRHGKRILSNGKQAVLVILKDLENMSEEDQRYWHSHEISEPTFSNEDEDFHKFVQRNLAGKFNRYNKPISALEESLNSINESCGELALFKKISNPHLFQPIQNNRKYFVDSCSELFKLIGPDNIDQDVLKSLLLEKFSQTEDDFVHKDTKRNLSTIQLLRLLEDNLVGNNDLTKIIKHVQNFRTDADHRIMITPIEENNFIHDFYEICRKVEESANAFADKLLEVMANLEE